MRGIPEETQGKSSFIRFAMSNQSTAAIRCPACGAVMMLAGVLPKLASHPELHTFRCGACKEVETRTAVVARCDEIAIDVHARS